MRRKLIAGNWKMNKLPSEVQAYITELGSQVLPLSSTGPEVLLALPYTHLQAGQHSAAVQGIIIAAQNVHEHAAGAYTGEISLAMLADLGVRWTLVGHSERRQYCGEDSVRVATKVVSAQKAGFSPILCIGESLAEREGGQMETVLRSQLGAVFSVFDPTKPLVVAYEPVWAIGTGVTATTEQAEQAHRFVRSLADAAVGSSYAKALRILYGGSVTATNAGALLAQENIDGALVGGASLKAADFAQIIRAAGH